ncbi:Ig-like domain-containing protein [Streptomyces sp. NPDC056387]|uniref:Ig-like domain-containing protein n=1 Tax=Streptomyces sp. NPDC056387 TaxID=3345803 RepID=UPI0035E065CC
MHRSPPAPGRRPDQRHRRRRLHGGGPVPLAATAAAADGATVSKVEFYSGTTLLGTDTTAPFTLDAPGLAAGSHSL